ncbi:MAG: sigma-70 family RNA polymerase sigma factor [Terracidiphilus sp.]
MNENPSNPVQAPIRTDDGQSVHREEAGTAQSTDELLLTRVKAGDQQAMTDVFDRYGSMVYSVALRVLKDPGQAEDVMQEILFQVWKNPGLFVEGRGSLGAWLAVMARNRAIDAVRRRRPTDPVEEVVLVSNTNLALEVERNSMMEKVREVLKGLPSEQQKSVEMAFFDGLTHAEISAKTGDPLGTVKTRIRAALISVRKAMQA